MAQQLIDLYIVFISNDLPFAWIWWCMPLGQTPRRQRQVDCEFEDSQGYTGSERVKRLSYVICLGVLPAYTSVYHIRAGLLEVRSGPCAYLVLTSASYIRSLPVFSLPPGVLLVSLNRNIAKHLARSLLHCLSLVCCLCPLCQVKKLST